jgi:hypothetical protein
MWWPHFVYTLTYSYSALHFIHFISPSSSAPAPAVLPLVQPADMKCGHNNQPITYIIMNIIHKEHIRYNEYGTTAITNSLFKKKFHYSVESDAES